MHNVSLKLKSSCIDPGWYKKFSGVRKIFTAPFTTKIKISIVKEQKMP